MLTLIAEYMGSVGMRCREVIFWELIHLDGASEAKTEQCTRGRSKKGSHRYRLIKLLKYHVLRVRDVTAFILDPCGSIRRPDVSPTIRPQ